MQARSGAVSSARPPSTTCSAGHEYRDGASSGSSWGPEPARVEEFRELGGGPAGRE
jgi:hypothetical protein